MLLHADGLYEITHNGEAKCIATHPHLELDVRYLFKNVAQSLVLNTCSAVMYPGIGNYTADMHEFGIIESKTTNEFNSNKLLNVLLRVKCSSDLTIETCFFGSAITLLDQSRYITEVIGEVFANHPLST